MVFDSAVLFINTVKHFFGVMDLADPCIVTGNFRPLDVALGLLHRDHTTEGSLKGKTIGTTKAVGGVYDDHDITQCISTQGQIKSHELTGFRTQDGFDNQSRRLST
jgi:hypothetical protein